MPLYDYECVTCGGEFDEFASIAERENVKSPCCDTRAKQTICAPTVITFPEGFWENITTEPLYISDRRQLKDACKRHDCYAPGELD